MKAQGRIREIINSITGLPEWSRYPATREEAFIEDVAKYYPPDVCPEHGGRTVFFTVTGLAACCAHHDAAAAYNEAVLSHSEPTTISEAQAMGKNYVWTPQANSYCGHPGKIDFANRCVFCLEARKNSPRQVAIRAGATWYRPEANDPCPRGHTALRRVANGICKQCEEENRAAAAQAPDTEAINKLCPDMVIARAAARGLGFKVYRTGKACVAGHTGWRYVSTGGCLTCMGR